MMQLHQNGLTFIPINSFMTMYLLLESQRVFIISQI